MKRRILIILGIMMLISLVPVFAKEGKATLLVTKLEQDDENLEIEELRTENSRTFKNRHGRRITVFSSEHLNYRTTDGRYKRINTKIVKTEQIANSAKSKRNASVTTVDRFPYKALENSIQAEFADSSEDGLLLSNGEHRIQFIIRHSNKRKAVVTENKIKYAKVFDNCDMVYTVEPGKIKDELIFYSAPKNPVITYQVNLNGLKHIKGRNGEIYLIDAMGRRVMTLMESFMYDQNQVVNGEPDPDRVKMIETRFHSEKGQLYCDLVLDMKWLKDRKRKYPIVVDPTVVADAKGLEWRRVLLHCPQNIETKIDYFVDVTGPRYHGHGASSRRPSRVSFTDLQGGDIFPPVETLGDYKIPNEEIPTPNFIAIPGHDYEIYTFGGRTKKRFGGTYKGLAIFTLIYSFQDFNEKQDRDQFLVTVNTSQTMERTAFIEIPQTVKFNYVAGLKIIKILSKEPYVIKEIGGISSGMAFLDTGEYSFQLSPQQSGTTLKHNRVQINFPYNTKDYESQIVLDTGLASTETVFKVPADGELFLDYDTTNDGLPTDAESIRMLSLPSISLYSEAKMDKQITLDLNKYTRICGGDFVSLRKETEYRLVVKRGVCKATRFVGSSYSGPMFAEGPEENFGRINLTVKHPMSPSKKTVSSKIQLIHGVRLVPESGGFANSKFKLQFGYKHDGAADDITLKEYKVQVSKDGSTDQPYFYEVKNLDLPSGTVTVPVDLGYLARRLNCVSGDRLSLYIKDAWDGYIMGYMKDPTTVTLDDLPPVVKFDLDFSQVTTDNSMNLKFEVDDSSFIDNPVLTWKINNIAETLQPTFSEDNRTFTYSIDNLPANSKVEMNVKVSDHADNQISYSQVFYTYPEISDLLAPVEIKGEATTGYKAELKLSKVETEYFRVVRQRLVNGQPATNPSDPGYYDTGYIDKNTLETAEAGVPFITIKPLATGTVSRGTGFVTVEFSVTDDGPIEKVEVYNGGTLLATLTEGLYKYYLSTEQPGSYVIFARAVDKDGLSGLSNVVKITVE